MPAKNILINTNHIISSPYFSSTLRDSQMIWSDLSDCMVLRTYHNILDNIQMAAQSSFHSQSLDWRAFVLYILHKVFESFLHHIFIVKTWPY
jgi:hypothetical protein